MREFFVLYGGCSSIGRASLCGSEGYGIVPRHPPQVYMTDDVLKPALALQVLQNKILLSDSQQIHVLMRDFLEAGNGQSLKVSDVATLLGRFQRDKVIKILEIFSARDTTTVVDIVRAVGIRDNYNLNNLEENYYTERTGFVCQVSASFCEYLQKFLTENTEAKTTLNFNPKLRQILVSLENAVNLDGLFQDKPFAWHCPIDRSKVGEIKSKEDLGKYLKEFTQGKFPSCKDRRHKNRFLIEGNTISFGTLPMKLEDIMVTKAQETEQSGV